MRENPYKRLPPIERRQDGSPWRVGVRDPDSEGNLGVLELTGQGVSVSGGYEKYFEGEDGERYWHILDPAAEDKPALERTMDGLKGLTDCVPGAKVKGRIYGANAWQRGEIEGNPALKEAYEMGRKA